MRNKAGVFPGYATRSVTGDVLGSQATRLARAMVTRYGMSDVLGKVSVNYDDMGQSLSSETRAAVESEVSTPASSPGALPLRLSHFFGVSS